MLEDFGRIVNRVNEVAAEDAAAAAQTIRASLELAQQAFDHALAAGTPHVGTIAHGVLVVAASSWADHIDPAIVEGS